MSSDIVIAARGITKVFAIYAKPADMLRELITGRPRHREFVALDDVSVTVHAGEAVGIMGRNGAGKSTLLKIIAGTLDATRGTAEINGRVAAILELGTGFHPQYSGRENAVMGGMCMGMTEREVKRKLDWIIDFSELRDFVDQPVRTYSTGMLARLAFAVVVAVDPKILIVDEALSVGDARFQLKCADKFREFRREGRTILLVSHSSEQVATMCDRAILLERGKLLEDGPAAEVTRKYHRLLFGGGGGGGGTGGGSGGSGGGGGASEANAATSSDQGSGGAEGTSTDAPAAAHTASDAEFDGQRPRSADELNAGTRMGDGRLRIQRISVLDEHGLEVRRLAPGGRFEFLFEAVSHDDFEDLSAGFLLRDRSGQTIYGLDTRLDQDRRFAVAAGERIGVRLRFLNHLGPGEYFLSFGVARLDGAKLDYCYDAVVLEVPRRIGVYHSSRVDLDASLAVEHHEHVESVESGAVQA